jgi:phosphoribosylformylglycinamidine synthase PurS subunit
VKARIIVYPRPEVLDPQGKAVHQALCRVGFDEVSEVRVGKSFDLEVAARNTAEARERLEAMCQRLLANRVMERYEIEVGAGDGKPTRGESPGAASKSGATRGTTAKGPASKGSASKGPASKGKAST